MTLLRQVVAVFVALSVVCGMIYPALVTVIGLVLFPHAAHGSLVVVDGTVIGSELVGQPFDDPRYFWGRPSATSKPYDGAASSGSNYGPLNPALTEGAAARIGALGAEGTSGVPVDLVTASSSGLDPHISPAAASFQVARVAEARGLDPAAVQQLVDAHVEIPQFGMLGAPRVNVLALNRALDGMR
jgi:K+-transporting ATPase ATPase C chain